MKIAALQLSTQAASNARLDYYLKLAAAKGAQLAVCGEYVMNDFFAELASAEQIAEQSECKAAFLRAFSAEHELQIIAPFVLPGRGGLIKCLLHFASGEQKCYEQQILMPYEHWNEAKFFANAKKKLKPQVLKIGELKIALMPSFEAHFDESFSKLRADLILCFCAHTFGSDERWRALLKTRAFTHNINILRINRVGKFAGKDGDWEFYGNSFLLDASGNIEQELGADEGMLLASVQKPTIASGFWRFERIRRELASR